MKLKFLTLILLITMFIMPVLADDNPFDNIPVNATQEVPVTNATHVNLTQPDISGHYDYVNISGDNHTANFGRLSFSTDPYVIENGSYMADIGQYLGKEKNQLLQADNSGDLIVKTSFYTSLIKEHFFIDYPVNEIGYNYSINLKDWTTKEYDPVSNTITEHTEYANNSTTDIRLDQWGNAVVYINDANTLVLPVPTATDAAGYNYTLKWELDKTNKTLKIGDLYRLRNVEYPVIIDPTEFVTNSGFETGNLSGWTAIGSAISVSNTAKRTGNYGLRITWPGSGVSQNVQWRINVTASGWFNPNDPYDEFSTGLSIYHNSTMIYDGYSISDNNWHYVSVTTSSYTDYTLIKFLKRIYGNNLTSYFDDFSLTVPVSAPIAAFSANSTSGTVPKTIAFTDSSTNSPTSWYWDFGDGGTSTSQNTSHTYNTPGTYTVTLNASNSYGYSLANQTILITVASAPIANFTAIPTLSVHFTDTSTGNPTSWDWDLGDGNATYNTPTNDLTHTYYTPGTYTVKMTAKNADGSSISSKTMTFTVTSGSTANAQYMASNPLTNDGWPYTNQALLPGQGRSVSITMKNIGQFDWNDTSNIYLMADNSSSNEATNFGFVPINITRIVQQGDSYTFNFNINVPSNAQSGTHNLLYRMYWGGPNGCGYFGDEISKYAYVGTIDPTNNNNIISNDTIVDTYGLPYVQSYIDTGFLTSYVNCSGVVWDVSHPTGGWEFSLLEASIGDVWVNEENSSLSDINSSLTNVIGSHYIEISTVTNSLAQSIDSGTNLQDSAATPGTEGTNASIIGTIAEPSINYASSTFLTYLEEAGIQNTNEWAFVVNIIFNLLFNSEEQQTSMNGDQSAKREWNYGYTNNIAHYSNYWYWGQWVKPDQEVQFSVTSGFKLDDTANEHTGLWPSVPSPGAMSNTHLITITAPPAPGTLSQAQLTQYGIQKVSMMEVQANPKAYGISDKSLKKLKDSGQKDVYYIPANKLKKLLRFQEVK